MGARFCASAVEFVVAEVVRPLRHRVLRPHQPFRASTYPGDDDPQTLHAAVRDGQSIAGVASIYRRSPESEDDPSAWHLRGLAVDERWRGNGVGASIVERLIEVLAGRGASCVWCTARSDAVAFYERMEFQAEGDWFDEPPLGPHLFMRRWI